MKNQTVQYLVHYYSKLLVLVFIPVLTFQKDNFAQSEGLSGITGKFLHFRNNDLQEKLFVHTDKNFYLAGEIIWFKIYDINEATNAPFDLSKVAYIELLDKNNVPVLQTKVALDKNGNGGSLFLPFTLQSGNYLFRAYTSWMKNFSPDYYFEQYITVINTTKSNDFPKVNDSVHYEVKFFPEGGDLVNGLQSEVGFHVVNQYGEGVNSIGEIINRQNDTILHFHPYKFGIGHFYLTPDKSQQYKAIVKIKGGPTLYVPLPDIEKNGLVMHVQDLPDNRLRVVVSSTMNEDKFCYLIVRTRESIKTAEVLFFKNRQATFTLDKNKLGEGISQFTIFNNMEQPVCERLYFIPPLKRLAIHAETNQPSYSPRNKTILQLHTNNETNIPIEANMSVSVYKLDSLQTADQSNILSYIWLKSELRGYIESPGYYFQNSNDSINQAADNLMLTQGWRRFNWHRLMENRLPVIQFAPELSGPVVSGKLVNTLTGLSVSDVLTYFSIIGSGAKVQGYITDSTGRFYFGMKNFYGQHQVVIETNTQTKDSIDRPEVFNPFSDKYADFSLQKFVITISLVNQLYDHNLWTEVQHAYHADVFDPSITIPDTSSFFGKPFKTYWLDNFIRYTTMEEVMREYVQEVATRIRDKHYRFMVVNNYDKSLYASLFSDDPLVILDGAPVFDIDKVIAFSPLKVQKLDVVTDRYFNGPIMADGILSYTTYKGDMANFPLDPHTVKIDYHGLQNELEFYSPEYSTEKEKSSHIPDFRNVLYWSPDIRTDKQGNASCSFYTSDIPGKYIVIADGITKDGHAGHASYTFDVKK